MPTNKSLRLIVSEERTYKVSANQKQNIPMTTIIMFYVGARLSKDFFVDDPTNIPATFDSNWPITFWGEDQLWNAYDNNDTQ